MTDDADRIIGLYERHAAAWDAERGRGRLAGERNWIARFAALARPGADILDLGCGSGEPIVPDLLGAGLAVTGIDSSPALIALCRGRFPGADWHVADMRTLDLGRRFGGILAWHSFFHLRPDDQAAMFERFARHAEPGAPLMFTSGPARAISIGEWQGEPLYHASLDPGEYHRLLVLNGFEHLDHRMEDPECGGATIWLARRAG